MDDIPTGRLARGLLLALGLGLLLAPRDAAAAANRRYVQKRYFEVTSGSSVSVTLRRPDVAGNLLIAFVVWDNGGAASVSDTRGNAYASAVGPTGAGGTHAQLFYAGDVAAGTNVVTATFATPITVRGALYVIEYAAVDGTSPLAGAVAATGSSLTMDSGALTVGTANALLIAGAASNGSVKRPARGYHARARRYGNLVAEQVAPAAGTYDVTATQTGTEWVMLFAVFRPAGADATAPSVPANLQASNVTSNAATLSWTASTDDVGVAGYRLFRDGVQIGTTGQPHYTDANLSPATTYAYAVAAYDAAGNVSATSAPLDVTTSAGPPAVVYPLKVGPTGRYLVGQNDVPFLLTGDSPQALIVNLSEAEADAFFADRQAAGFNVVWINLLCATYTGGRADASTYDGIVPFTTPGDLATPNAAYFARVDDMISLAAQHGLTVLLDPAETGSFLSVLSANGVTKSRDYGRFLGTRYRSFDNIVWMSGNDFQTWPNPADDAVVQAVARGIQDTDDRHLHTVELDYLVSGSLDDPTWAPLIQLNASYTYYPTYAQVLTDYDRPNAIPTFLVEANYEFEHNAADQGTPAILRRQAYWSLLSGAAGQMYGNGYTWPFASGWQDHLDTPGSQQMGHVKLLFASRPWFDLIPDQAHALVTAGYGTYDDSGSLGANDYVTAARTPDGALALAYLPTVRTLDVDMSRLGGPVQASWYDPSTGTFAAIPGAPFPNAGSRSFTPPGSNGAGDGDWVLVLEAPSVPPDTTPPSVPAGLSVTASSSSSISIAWSPSHDDVGVAGYRVYRDGAFLRTTSSPACTDIGLTAATAYTYTVAAYDYASNLSAPSAPLVATTTGPAPSFVQQAYATPQSPQTVVSATYAGAQGAGDANLFAIGWNDTTASIASVSDSAGNLYQPAVATSRGNGLSQAIYWAPSIVAAAAGTNQVTVRFDQPAVFVDLRVTEYAGLRATGGFDAGASASGNGGNASVAVATSRAGELLFAAGVTGAVFTAPGPGFTSRVITASDGDLVEDAVAASAGTQTATAPLSGGTWLLQVAAFAGP